MQYPVTGLYTTVYLPCHAAYSKYCSNENTQIWLRNKSNAEQIQGENECEARLHVHRRLYM